MTKAGRASFSVRLLARRINGRRQVTERERREFDGALFASELDATIARRMGRRIPTVCPDTPWHGMPCHGRRWGRIDEGDEV